MLTCTVLPEANIFVSTLYCLFYFQLAVIMFNIKVTKLVSNGCYSNSLSLATPQNIAKLQYFLETRPSPTGMCTYMYMLPHVWTTRISWFWDNQSHCLFAKINFVGDIKETKTLKCGTNQKCGIHLYSFKPGFLIEQSLVHTVPNCAGSQRVQ